MASDDQEDQQLRAVTLQNAQSVLLARRRVEEDLRKQSEWLRITLASIGDAVISTDIEGRVTFMNKVAEDLTGWPMPEALGRALPEVFHIINEQTRRRVQDPAQHALKDGSIVGLANHTILMSRDGTERPIDDSAAPIRDVGGAVSGAVLVFRDVMEQRRVELEHRQAEARYRSLVDATAQIVWTTDPHGQVVEDCPSWRAFTGQTYEQWKGWGWTNAVHPDDREHTAQVWGRSVASKSICQLVYRLRRHDGEYRWSVVRVVPVMDVQGDIREWVGMITDITERKQAGDALEESEAKFKLLFECSPLPKWALEVKTLRFVDVNEAAIQLYGYTREEFLQLTVLDVRTAEVGEALTALLDRSARHLPGVDACQHRKKGGELIDVEVHLSEITLSQERVWLASIIDVTARKMTEAALEDTARRRNEFLAMLAHELRNPLAPIRNAGHVLRLAPDNREVVQSTAEMVERQIGHLVRLVDDLLDVTRIDRGKIELRQERIELAPVVTHVVAAAQALIQCMEHDVTVTLPPQPVYLYADPIRLAQIIGNLLNNACKFTDKGGTISVTVGVEGGDSCRPEAVVRIRDNGVGIPADQLRRIFEMFTQVDTSLERSRDGLGIGLALAKNLVEMHGGTLEAHSEGVGLGSEFVLRLPIPVDAPMPLPPVPSSTVSPPISRTILVVDDNRDSAMSLATLLSVKGHQTHTAFNGNQAVEAVGTLNPDVVLLDIGMPTMNGYEACRRIREAPGGKNMLLIAVTGWGQEDDRDKSSEAGFDFHLVKPVDLDALIRMLDSR
ncbi:MAG: PAS domain S-box protein [Gemmatimonadales bacterium]|nr:PAS domain S-box protein [Gemmatimonadales bacterium]